MSNFDDIVGVIGQKYPEVRLTDKYRDAVQRMVDLHFSTARILRAVEIAQEHYSQDGKTITPENLIRGINKAEEFARVATATTVNGRLVFGAATERAVPDDTATNPGCAVARVSSTGSRRLWDEDDCADYDEGA